MSCVLTSLRLSMLSVAQALISLIHDSIELNNSDIFSGRGDICNCMSSANDWCVIGCESTMVEKGLM